MRSTGPEAMSQSLRQGGVRVGTNGHERAHHQKQWYTTLPPPAVVELNPTGEYGPNRWVHPPLRTQPSDVPQLSVAQCLSERMIKGFLLLGGHVTKIVPSAIDKQTVWCNPLPPNAGQDSHPQSHCRPLGGADNPLLDVPAG